MDAWMHDNIKVTIDLRRKILDNNVAGKQKRMTRMSAIAKFTCQEGKK